MYNVKAVTQPLMAASNGHKWCYAVYTPLSNNVQYQHNVRQPTQGVSYPIAFAQPLQQHHQMHQHPNQFMVGTPGDYQAHQQGAPTQALQQLQVVSQAQQQQQQLQHRTQEQHASNNTPLAPYADQLNAAYYAHQQQQQQQMYNEQQRQLLRALYANHPDRSNTVSALQAQPAINDQFYTHDQYVNYLNNQHSQILNDQQIEVQKQYRNTNYTNPTTLSYTMPAHNAISVPLTPTTTQSPRNGLGTQYSPSTKVSRVNYASGNLAYNY